MEDQLKSDGKEQQLQQFFEETKVRSIISEMVTPILKTARDNLTAFNK